MNTITSELKKSGSPPALCSKENYSGLSEYLPVISNLFMSCGIKSVTMHDIAKNLGISTKTLYKHFSNKKDVVSKIAQFEINKEFTELNKLCAANKHVIDQLEIIFRYTFEKKLAIHSSLIFCMNKYYPLVLDEINKRRKKFLLDLIMKNIRSGIRDGLYRENINLSLIMKYYSFMLESKSIEMHQIWSDNNPKETFNTLFFYHIRGIANNEGIKYLEKKFRIESIHA